MLQSSHLQLHPSGSWDGEIRLWKVDAKLKSFSLIGAIPALGVVNSLQILQCPKGTATRFTWASENQADVTTETVVSVNTKSAGPPSAILVAGVGHEMRFGRWVERKGEGYLNGALVVALHTRTSSSNPSSL